VTPAAGDEKERGGDRERKRGKGGRARREVTTHRMRKMCAKQRK